MFPTPLLIAFNKYPNPNLNPKEIVVTHHEAHAVGVTVEGELGCLGSLETGEAGEEVADAEYAEDIEDIEDREETEEMDDMEEMDVTE